MRVFYNDVVMQQAHRQDLLNEAHLDRLEREARGGRRNRASELASNLISGLGCSLVRWGKRIGERSQRRLGGGLINLGLRLNGTVAAMGSDPCDCCA